MGTIGYSIFLDLALILLTAKVLGLVMRKLGLPQVVGTLLAGLFLGMMIWGDKAPVKDSVPLAVMAEIGVVLIMFTAGMETDLKEMKRNGKASIVITLMGVIVPMGLGYVVSGAFHGFANVYTNLFVGTILTATSVGITVEALREMGKLKGKVGSSILAAAILDDIIGIVILSVVIGLTGNDATAGKSEVIKAALWTVAKIIIFFIAAFGVGIVLHLLLKKFDSLFGKRRRTAILSLIVCFFFAYAAEEFFGIADITGAFAAGIIFSNLKDTSTYVEKRLDATSYLLFSPIFFARIGLNVTFGDFTWGVALFGLCFLVAALASKFIGCGAGARMCGYTTKESLQVGLGMMARGEVALIVAAKGIDAGLLGGEYVAIVILLVIVSSLSTPILLKLAFKTSKKELLLMQATGIRPESYLADNVTEVDDVIDLTPEVFGTFASLDDISTDTYSSPQSNTFDSNNSDD